jgi:hypothetical protein
LNNQFTIPFFQILRRNNMEMREKNNQEMLDDINQRNIYLNPTELGNILAEIRDSGSTFNIDFIGQPTVALYEQDIYRQRHGGEGRKFLTPSTILQEGRFYAENEEYKGEILRVHLLLNNIQELQRILATKTSRSSSGGSGGRSSSGGSGGRSSGDCLNAEDLYKASFDPIQNKIVYRTRRREDPREPPSGHCFSMDDLKGIKIVFWNALGISGYPNKVVLMNPYTQKPLVNNAGELNSLLGVLPEAERPFFTLAAFERETDEARTSLEEFRMKYGKRNKKRSSRKSSRKRRGSKNEKQFEQKVLKELKLLQKEASLVNKHRISHLRSQHKRLEKRIEKGPSKNYTTYSKGLQTRMKQHLKRVDKSLNVYEKATRKKSRKVSRKRRSAKRKVSRKRRSAKRKVSRKRRSVKRKVSRKRRSAKRKVSRKRRSAKRKVSRKRKSAKRKSRKSSRKRRSVKKKR